VWSDGKGKNTTKLSIVVLIPVVLSKTSVEVPKGEIQSLVGLLTFFTTHHYEVSM
jgi:hypothetical protein